MQAARAPDAPAIVMHTEGDERAGAAEAVIDYRELNIRANRMARSLRRLGVGPETLVGLCIERTPELIVGMLAILKAGGA